MLNTVKLFVVGY